LRRLNKKVRSFFISFFSKESIIVLFDPTNYQLPNKNNVDWTMTRKNLSIFLSEYKNIREKLGLRATPKLKETYSLLNNS